MMLIKTVFVQLFAGFLFGLGSPKPTINSVKLIFYHGPKFDDNEKFELTEATKILEHPKFDSNKKTTLYIHGYLENQTVESAHVIVDAYLKRPDYNLLVLDWSSLAEGNYLFDAVPNAKKLGQKLADVLIELFNGGLNIENFHLVGHSLGGQMVGIIGRTVIKKSGARNKLKRITALDPAFPAFYLGVFARHITKADAEFVDIIHTDAWLYGAPISSGTVDFWPNGGKTLQPGCPRRNYQMLTDNDLCSHRRSWRFWAESVIGAGENFLSVRTTNWSKFKSNQIESSKPISMGLNCPTDVTGDYFLQTNGATPFARGEEGTRYISVSQLPGVKDKHEMKHERYLPSYSVEQY